MINVFVIRDGNGIHGVHAEVTGPADLLDLEFEILIKKMLKSGISKENLLEVIQNIQEGGSNGSR